MTKHETITPLEALQRQVLFAGLPLANLQEIVPHIVFQKSVKGEIIFKQGESTSQLILVVAGQAQLINRSPDGRELSIQMIHPGGIAGELSVIDGAPNAATMIAHTEAIIGKLPAPIAMQLLTKIPLLAERMLKHLSLTIRQTNLLHSVLNQNRAHTRIYSFLLNVAKAQANNVLTIEGLPNQQTMASLTNVSRETISRALQILIKDGVIERKVKGLVIKNPEKLRQLAQADGLNVQPNHPKNQSAEQTR